MSVTLTVHRGTREIGGSCVEIAHASGARLVLDVGRPLDAPAEAIGLLPTTLDLSRPATVVLSHSHLDHGGLVGELPADWPVWASEDTAAMMAVVPELRGKSLGRALSTWPRCGAPPPFGSFRVTPIATDHSAFDAAMLLVECEGRRVLYTGDLRRHGRKGALVERFLRNPPRDVDVLVLEGTNLGQDKPVMSETTLEDNFADLFRSTKGRVFVYWSAQNLDRTVTLYRAAKKTGRTLVIDLYAADVLDRVAEGTGLPRPGWANLKVVITRSLRRRYIEMGREDFVTRMVRHGVAVRDLTGDQHVVMLRESLVRDYASGDVVPVAEDAVVHSAWSGYVDREQKTYAWAQGGGARLHHLHTSGHASPADLRAIAKAVAPGAVVPVHGANWDTEGEGFGPLRRLRDGEPLTVGA